MNPNFQASAEPRQDEYYFSAKKMVAIMFFILPAFIGTFPVVLFHVNRGLHGLVAPILPLIFWPSVAAAALIPAALIWRTSQKTLRRLGLIFGLWCLLVVQLLVIFACLIAVSGPRPPHLNKASNNGSPEQSAAR